MSKATILDRLAGAMQTLGKREGKALTPRQRVAAAQRWNSLAGIADDRLADLDATSEAVPVGSEEYDRIMDVYNKEGRAYDDMKLLVDQGNAYDNPFLSDNIDKYAEQSDFLDWCRDKGVEPNARSLKQFRWETYQTLPYDQRRWIANKRDVLNEIGNEHPEIKTRRQLNKMLQDEWEMDEYPDDFWREPYTSIREFPDDFDYMWRY